MRFAGRCIDGPKRSEFIERPEPYFRVAVPPRLAVCGFDPEAFIGSLDVHYVEYVWSYSLGEWCVRDLG